MANALDFDRIREYIADHIGLFHENRLARLSTLQLETILKRKNPYLYRAKNLITAGHLVESLLSAHLSSQEETLFGTFMEGLGVFINAQVYGGYKPTQAELEGIDLVFETPQTRYVVEIKSGPNWGNSSQVKKLVQNFETARHILPPTDKPTIAVNGCSYGRETCSYKSNGNYWKLCGQDFWYLISGSDTLYVDIIEPLGHQAKARNDAFNDAYAALVNQFTAQFIAEYCLPSGAIDWPKLVALSSQRAGDVPDLLAK